MRCGLQIAKSNIETDGEVQEEMETEWEARS